MSGAYVILLLEDEPLIMMDLEFAAEDRGCAVLAAAAVEPALRLIADAQRIDVAVLDVSLGGEENCLPVARELERRGIPYLLHSGDLDRQEETVRQLDAPLIAKPAMADAVIAAAIEAAGGGARTNDGPDIRSAAE